MASVEQKEQVLAYKLLVPTFIILFIIAIYPLGTVIITSFTDKIFADATNRKTNFVGIDNYKQLLALTATTVSLSNEELLNIEKKVSEDIEKIKKKSENTWTTSMEKSLIKKRKKERSSGAAERQARGTWRNKAKIYENEKGEKPLIRYSPYSSLKIGSEKYLVIGASTPKFIDGIKNTLTFTFWSVLLETILGLIIALVVNSEFKGKGIMRSIMLVPWAIITVVSARIWQSMLRPDRTGLFNSLFSKFGGSGQTAFLTKDSIAIPTIIAIDVWKTAPFMALLILAGLQTIPSSLYEAAEVDGAGKVKQFFSITLPLLKPTIAVALIFRALDALRVFDLFNVLLGERLYSMASYNYSQLISAKAEGMASAVGMIIFFIIFGFAILCMKTLGVGTDD